MTGKAGENVLSLGVGPHQEKMQVKHPLILRFSQDSSPESRALREEDGGLPVLALCQFSLHPVELALWLGCSCVDLAPGGESTLLHLH